MKKLKKKAGVQVPVAAGHAKDILLKMDDVEGLLQLAMDYKQSWLALNGLSHFWNIHLELVEEEMGQDALLKAQVRWDVRWGVRLGVR